MRFGVNTFVTDESIGPAALGPSLEERGFDSLFVAEHTHIPTSRETPWPAGAELPREYYRTIDVFVTLTAAAVATERLVVGTGISLVIQHDPIVLAKQVASLDLVSGGRFVFGIGAGWNREEMRSHGTDPTTRMALLRERILAMKEIWTKDEAEFHGEYVDFEPLFLWPKPVQKPHPPIMVGGAGATTFDRVLEYGDGWSPIYLGDADNLVRQVERLRKRAADAGRGRPVIQVYAVAAKPEVIETFAAAEIDEVLFNLPQGSVDDALRRLDHLAAVKDEFTG